MLLAIETLRLRKRRRTGTPPVVGSHEVDVGGLAFAAEKQRRKKEPLQYFCAGPRVPGKAAGRKATVRDASAL